MRYRLFWTSGVFTLATLSFSVGSAHAQTTAVGPYYATPSWDQKISCSSATNCTRFIVLSNWNSDAVLDRETGLVWQRAPETDTVPWESAVAKCGRAATGGRYGWRLPQLHELMSLSDPNVTSSPFLPPGHPFAVPASPGDFWTATTSSDNTSSAWVVFFFPGPVADIQIGTHTKNESFPVWCVRGGGPAGA